MDEFLQRDVDSDAYKRREEPFLIKLRIHLEWDAESFARLERAMTACCEAVQGETSVERWIAEGFWYVGWFVENWTSHEAWRADPARAAIDAGCNRLFELCNWFFTGTRD